MKKIVFLIGCILVITSIHAQNYLIIFAGTGGSTTIDSVKVENLTQSASLTLSGNDTLHLTGDVVINDMIPSNESIMIYPNPMQGQTELSFYSKQVCSAQMTIYDITGKEILEKNYIFSQGTQSYQLTGLKQGIYFIHIRAENYFYTAKLISLNFSQSDAKIEYLETVKSEVAIKILKSLKEIINMSFNIGDSLRFTGYSGTYTSIVVDIPTGSKTITFIFDSIANCGILNDVDGNIYNTVQIGTQCWMRENLKTSKYRNNSEISNTINNTMWNLDTTGAWCYYNNDIVYNAVYGKLYNWFALNNSNDLCPTNWHVPSDSEWNVLTNYLGGVGVAGGKMKEVGYTHWNSPNTGASNSSGFTGLPAGLRNGTGTFGAYIGNYCIWWSSSEGGVSSAYTRELLNDHIYVLIDNNDKTYGFSVRCIQGARQHLPIVITDPVTNNTDTTAISGGNVTSDGGASVIARGVCWSTNPNPTISNSNTSDGAGTGMFSSNIAGLVTNTNYYVRAYATNSIGTSYGNQMNFIATKTPNCGTITDYDGNIYNTVTTGMQCWMQENMRTSHYNNGSFIPNITDNAAWSVQTTGAWCDYNNIAVNDSVYGKLYNWYAVNNSNSLCPTGWHIPTNFEWITLADYLGGGSIAGGKLKETGTSHWSAPNTGATNESEFTALGGGWRNDGSGTFANINQTGVWWSSTEYDSAYAIYCRAYYMTSDIANGQYYKQLGHSVRCVKIIGPSIPSVTTDSVTNITDTTATSEGFVTSDGGSQITARGMCWSTSQNPTIANSHTTDGTGTGLFTSNFTGLTPHTTYYARAYASNSAGTAYGNQTHFYTHNILNCGTVTDINSNVYNTIIIGTQCWMRENLKTTKYRNNNQIPDVADSIQWASLTTGAFCNYNNDSNNVNTYGHLYNWYTVADNRKLCPLGWHIPMAAEWDTLSNYLGGWLVAGGKLKEGGSTHWQRINYGATNETGFTALPGGRRFDNGSFTMINTYCQFWASTVDPSQLADRANLFNFSNVITFGSTQKTYGYSVRCLRD